MNMQMASADPREEFLYCSICLEIFTDPVTLPCGDNFCGDCIDNVMNTQEESGGYSCPKCGEMFLGQPKLKKNVVLCKIVDGFLSAYSEHEDYEVFCTYCIDSSVPAVKYCALCDASLCDKHMEVHSKSPEHVLSDPTTFAELEECDTYDEYYDCSGEDGCTCESCSWDAETECYSEEEQETPNDMLEKGEEPSPFKSISKYMEEVPEKGNMSGQDEKIPASSVDWKQFMDEQLQKKRHLEEMCNKTSQLSVSQHRDTGGSCNMKAETDEHRPMHEKHFNFINFVNLSHWGGGGVRGCRRVRIRRRGGSRGGCRGRGMEGAAGGRAQEHEGRGEGGRGVRRRAGIDGVAGRRGGGRRVSGRQEGQGEASFGRGRSRGGGGEGSGRGEWQRGRGKESFETRCSRRGIGRAGGGRGDGQGERGSVHRGAGREGVKGGGAAQNDSQEPGELQGAGRIPRISNIDTIKENFCFKLQLQGQITIICLRPDLQWELSGVSTVAENCIGSFFKMCDNRNTKVAICFSC
ncbi:uncharacterized protein [Hyperolius riggenbachi]|uniref:uncharacterized protein n=1 Tax=Hyperolius riggenbachi TaxID=752182 RepID=UPI0035A36BC2